VEGAAAEPEQQPPSRWTTASRSVWVPIFVVVLVVWVGVFLFTTSDRVDDEAGPVPTTADDGDGFTVAGEDGTLEFDQDDDEASVEFGDGEDDGRFSFDLDGDGITAEGDGGSFELTGALPPGWPDDFPEPPAGEVARGSVVDAGELVQRSATFRSARTADVVVAYYADALADAAPLLESDGRDGPTTISFEGPWTGFVTVSPAEEGSVVAVHLFEEPTPTTGG
jgi:hypothetical protein